MSLLTVVPDLLTAASGNLQNIGSGLRTANAAAAAQTTAIAAPAVDEVSQAITAVLGSHAQQFQNLSAQAAAFHDDFVNLLNGGAGQYLSSEVANAQQGLANAVNAPASALRADATIDNLLSINQNSNFGPLQFSQSVGGAGVFQSVALNGPFGQIGALSLSGVSALPSGVTGSAALIMNSAATVNTAFGPLTLLSANAAEYISPTGGFSAAIGGVSPLGPQGISVNGILPFFITGGSITSLGWEFAFQGNQFSITPVFLRPLGLFA
jgi:hypothetical protein